jgi:hypothetical protein
MSDLTENLLTVRARLAGRWERQVIADAVNELARYERRSTPPDGWTLDDIEALAAAMQGPYNLARLLEHAYLESNTGTTSMVGARGDVSPPPELAQQPRLERPSE